MVVKKCIDAHKVLVIPENATEIIAKIVVEVYAESKLATEVASCDKDTALNLNTGAVISTTDGIYFMVKDLGGMSSELIKELAKDVNTWRTVMGYKSAFITPSYMEFIIECMMKVLDEFTIINE